MKKAADKTADKEIVNDTTTTQKDILETPTFYGDLNKHNYDHEKKESSDWQGRP